MKVPINLKSYQGLKHTSGSKNWIKLAARVPINLKSYQGLKRKVHLEKLHDQQVPINLKSYQGLKLCLLLPPV